MDPIAAGDWMGTENLPHVDGHVFAWQGDTLWLGCDGGVWLSDDSGSTWDGRNAGLVTRQYYGFDIDPIREDRILGGTQDNKTNLRLGPGDDDWEWVLDGDGFDCAINPLVPDLVYGTIYGTLVFRSFDGGFEWEKIAPTTGGDLTPFETPLAMRPDLPWHLYHRFEPGLEIHRCGHVMERAGHRGRGRRVVHRCRPFGGDHTRRSCSASHRKGIRGVSRAPTGARPGGPLPWPPSSTASPCPDTIPSSRLAGLARTPDGEPQLVRTTDGGHTWHAADTGLPPFAVQTVSWHPQDPDLAFAGTDVGLYRSSDGGLELVPRR